MKNLWLFLLVCLLTGCAAGTQGVTPEPEDGLPNLGAAPELTNETWLNSDSPLRLADLRGQVVLIDMWTYG